MDKIKIERTWLQGSPVQVDNLMGNAFVGEAGAHEFLISGKDNACNVVPITGTITGKFLSSTMTTFALSGYVTEGVASVTLPSECYGAPGQFVVSIFATNGSTTTCIYCGVGSIFRTSTAAIAYPTTTLPDLTLLINQLDDVIASFPADLTHLLGAIAPTFVDNQPFTAGQYVWYNQVLYRFTADHPAGSWAGSADTVVAVVGTELNSTVRCTQQVLTDAQKTVARSNIDAADADDVTDLELTTVQVTPQTFDDNSKSQARSNIGAASSGDLSTLSGLVSQQGGYISDLTAAVGTVPAGETVEGQITDLKSAIDNLYVAEVFDYSSVVKSKFTIRDDGKWAQATGTSQARSYTFSVPSTAKKLVVTGDANGSIIAWLKTYAPVAGENVDFATGYTGRIVLEAGETKEYLIDGNMAYFYALLSPSDGTDKAPIVAIEYMNTDSTLSMEHVPADADAVGNIIYAAKDRNTHTPKILTYYVITGDSFDAKSMPNYTCVYNRYSVLAPTFEGTDMPDVGLRDNSYLRIEKLGLTNAVSTYLLHVQCSSPQLNMIMWRQGDSYRWEVLASQDYTKELFKQVNDQLTTDSDFYRVPLIDYSEMGLLTEQDGAIVENEETVVPVTDYIPCQKFIAFNILSSTERIVAYFYTKSGATYTLTWDVLNYTTSTGYKNYFGRNAYNKVIEVPNYENTYVRLGVCAGKKSKVEVFMWSGKHIGCDLATRFRFVDPTTHYESNDHENFNYFGSVIPGDAKYLIVTGMAIRDVYGYDSDNSVTVLYEDLHHQILKLPRGFAYFRVNVALCSAQHTTDTTYAGYRANSGAFNANAYMSVLLDYDKTQMAYGMAEVVKATAESICSLQWTCKKTFKTYDGSTYFYKNRIFSGVPYTSEWRKPHFLGWHISKHTLVNAMNDADSKFYLEHGRNGRGSGYGFVCSAFASLITGAPYPSTTNGLVYDPNMEHIREMQPITGRIMYNGAGHCLVPIEAGFGLGYKEYTIAESINPATSYKTHFDFITSPQIYGWNYINDYMYSCLHKSATGLPQGYDLSDDIIVEGTARPYLGDCGVYTSDMDVTINIKADTAQVLYYQECEYSGGNFTLVGNAMSIDINGATTVNIDKDTLSDRAFYAVWTDVDESKKEHFEYHVIVAQTYTKSADNLIFSSDDFWYALWWQADEEEGITIIVPRLDSGDYSEYCKAYNIPADISGYMFFKGTLGAYVVPMVPA